jgi:hypothetical protein
MSLSTFAYQNLLGPTFSTLLTGLWQAWVTIPVFLGIGLGLWFTFTWRSRAQDIGRMSFYLLPLSYAIVFVFFGFTQHKIDTRMLDLAQHQPPYIIEQLMSACAPDQVWSLLLIAMLPFFVYGCALASQLAQTSLSAYRIELLGILVGSLLGLLMLEQVSWSGAAVLIFSAGLVGALLIPARLRRRVRWPLALLVWLAFVSALPEWDLTRDLHLVARDFLQQSQVTELATRWKSFAKVQLLHISSPHEVQRVISIGDGTGHAKVFNYDAQFSHVPSLPTVRLAALPHPQRVLILFAGAGAELLGLHQLLGTSVETWGIEINSAMMDLARLNGGAELEAFWRAYPSHYILADNRTFLETTPLLFDSIVYSWSGATVANFSGAILHTTQYSFTSEALHVALTHLRPQGLLIVMGGNKLNLLMQLKSFQLKNLSDRVLLFDSRPASPWRATWDNFILIYKNGIWSDNDIEQAQQAAGVSYQLGLRPGLATTPPFRRHLQLLQSDDPELIAQQMWRRDRVLPQIPTDDHPFAYRNTPQIFTQTNWMHQVMAILKHPNFEFIDGAVWVFVILFLLLAISLLSRHLVIGDLPIVIGMMAWAPLSAACFLFFLYKALLLLGLPTSAFLVVQSALQLGALLGFYGVKWTSSRTSRLGLLGALILFGGVVYGLRQSTTPLFQMGQPLIAVGLAVVILLITAGYSLFFMQSLSRLDCTERLFGFIWAYETLLSGAASLLGAFLIEEVGLTSAVMTLLSLAAALFLLGVLSGGKRNLFLN